MHTVQFHPLKSLVKTQDPIATMPVFKVRPEQPDLPWRSSSVPPMHLHSPQASHVRSPATHLPHTGEQCTPTKPRKLKTFAPWSRLPQHIRRRILAHTLVPDGPGTPITIGLPEHHAHLNTTAVPIFLALGSWGAYLDAASIFYQRVHLNLSLFPDSAMAFLTSPATLRPRCLVAMVELRFTIEDHLLLFDTGYTVARSRGKLVKMNIPTVLRSMKTHGRLGEVRLLLPRMLPEDSGSGTKSVVPEYYFPMAYIRLAGWVSGSGSGSDDTPESSKTSVLSRHARPAGLVVAPVFLVCRAFQSGLLPLLENGAFGKTKLGVIQEYSNSTAPVYIDGSTVLQSWLGATLVDILDSSPTDPQTWADPFPLTGGDPGEPMANPADEAQELSGDEEIVPSRNTGHKLVSSPIKYPTPTSGSSDADSSSSEEVVINFDALRDESRTEEGVSQGEPELSDGDTSSDDSSSSEDMLHGSDNLGMTPRVNEDSGAAGPWDESSPTSDSPDSLSPIPAVHLEHARAGLITTLTAAIESEDTMEVIARATADRQLTTYKASEGPCRHDDATSDCLASRCMDEESSGSSDEDDETPTCKVPPAITRPSAIDPNETMSGPFPTGHNTCSTGDNASVRDGDSDGSSSAAVVKDEHGDEMAEDAMDLNVDGGLAPTDCAVVGIVTPSAVPERRSREVEMVSRADSIDLGLDSDHESCGSVDSNTSELVAATEPTDDANAKGQVGTKPDNTNMAQIRTPTTPARLTSGFNVLTPQSTRSKPSVKSKGTQTKRAPYMAKVKAKAASASNDGVSKKRKAPHAASDGPARSSKASRRKRARALKGNS